MKAIDEVKDVYFVYGVFDIVAKVEAPTPVTFATASSSLTAISRRNQEEKYLHLTCWKTNQFQSIFLVSRGRTLCQRKGRTRAAR